MEFRTIDVSHLGNKLSEQPAHSYREPVEGGTGVSQIVGEVRVLLKVPARHTRTIRRVDTSVPFEFRTIP